MVNCELHKIDDTHRDSFITNWENSFSRKLHKTTYDWIFDKQNLIYTLNISGEIVAGYCLYPLISMINGKLEKALLCNNVFVSPAHQGKQLFVKISKMSLVDAAKNRLGKLAYGIPNELALPGHKRVGWEVYPQINFLEAFRRLAPDVIGVNWFRHTLNDRLRSDIEKCSMRSSDGRGFSVIKTTDFVRWRYEAKPNSKYWFGFKFRNDQLVAYCVCKYFSEHLVLHFIDIDGTDNLAIAELISEAHGIPENFNKINVWSSSIHRKIFIEEGYKMGVQTSNLIFIDPARLAPFDFKGSMNIVLGDNDVF